MKEVILATVEGNAVVLYPEVIAILKGELHEGMIEGYVTVNPYAQELQKIRVILNNNRSLPLFSYMASRSAQENGRTTYYANV